MQTRLKHHEVPRETVNNAIAIGFIGKTELDILYSTRMYLLLLFITVFFYDVLSTFLSIGIILLLLNYCTEIFCIKILIAKKS